MGVCKRARTSQTTVFFFSTFSLDGLGQLMVCMCAWDIVLSHDKEFRNRSCNTTVLPVPVAAPSKASVCSPSPAGIVVSIPPETWISVYSVCCMLSGRGLCDELITRSEESYRLWCVVCDLEAS